MEQNARLSLFPCCPVYRTREDVQRLKSSGHIRTDKAEFLVRVLSLWWCKKAQRSSTILHAPPVPRRPCTGWLLWRDREKQFRWQLTSVSKHRVLSAVISWIHFANTEEYLVRICLCDQGDIRNLNVNVFCSLSFYCSDLSPNKCPFLCWVTEDFGYRPLFEN